MTEHPDPWPLRHLVLRTPRLELRPDDDAGLLELVDLAHEDIHDPSWDWLVLVDSSGGRTLAFQQVTSLRRTTWPTDDVPMQLHLDMTVPSVEELHEQPRRAEDLGARVLLDRTSDPDEPLYVLADPAGHPFCVFVL